MKTLILLVVGALLWAAPSPIYAQDSGSAPLPEGLVKQEKNYDTRTALLSKFYDDCRQHDVPVFGEFENDFLCSCLSKEADDTFSSFSDLKTLTLQEKGWIPLKDRLMYRGYLDCMADVSDHFVQNECTRSFESRPEFTRSAEICLCMGDAFQNYMKNRAVNLITLELQGNPRSLSPLNSFFTTFLFEDQYERSLRSCIHTHEYRWE